MLTRRLSVTILALLTLAVPVLRFLPAGAAPGLFNRSLTLSTSEVSATADYRFEFDITNSGVLGSIYFEFCANDPIPFTPCTQPSGFDISAATLSQQTGETGFTIDPGVTANTLLLTRAPAAATPQTSTYQFDGVINPDIGPASYYVRLITYATDDGTGPAVEEAGIAFAIIEAFDVSAYVPPFLTFCVGISITGNNCATAAGNLIDFGILSETAPRLATSQMAAATNGTGGVSIAVIGTTMTSGVNTIPALAARNTSVPGSGQFGINLRDNSNPNVGLDPSGPGTIVPVGDYNFVDEFKFQTGEQIANSPLPTDFTTLTVTYLVNIAGTQAPGVYTATLTYVASATF